jgi:hypothetical protein
MNREDNNLKDTSLSQNKSNSLTSFSLSYKKTNKLITALYMVTDIIDITEPIRTKLRFLGAEIISDINALNYSKRTDITINITKKITEIITFLDIVHALAMVSAMNSSILKKEFIELKRSLEDGNNNSVWLEEFLMKDNPSDTAQIQNKNSVRLGVQNSGSLMKVLKDMDMSNRNSMSDRLSFMSDKKNKEQNFVPLKREGIDILKKERRFEIVNIIRNNNNIATITDIKNNVRGVLKNCGEKTLQRELVAMVADGVLKKEGEKRWSRYGLSGRS